MHASYIHGCVRIGIDQAQNVEMSDGEGNGTLPIGKLAGLLSGRRIWSRIDFPQHYNNFPFGPDFTQISSHGSGNCYNGKLPFAYR